MIELPDWTEFNPEEEAHRGLDPLGLEAVGAGIVQRRLLPGITNATKHVRYYGFFCWVFWTFWQKTGRKPRLSDQRKWLTRLENILRAATLLKDPKILDLVGVRKAIRIDGLATNARVDIARRGAASAFVPANYSSSFRALGCGMRTKGSGAQLTSIGQQLAKAFDSAFRRYPGSRSPLAYLLSDKARVPAGKIRAVADAIRLRPVHPNESEHPLLLDLLLRTRHIRKGRANDLDQARSRSFTLLMEIAEQAQGTLDSYHDLHQVFATGELPNRRRFVPPPGLRYHFELWKRYQERQYVKLSIYSLWHEVVLHLAYRAAKTATTRELLAHCDSALDASELARNCLGVGHSLRTVHDTEQRLMRRLREKPQEFGRGAIKLVEVLLDVRRESQDRIGAAVSLILMVSCYWKISAATLPEASIHREGGRDRLSLETLASDTDQFGDGKLRDYLGWVVETYVLRQATRVATQKLLVAGEYRFFIVRDDDGYRLVKQQNPDSYLSYDSSRIGSACTLMADLGFLDLEEGIRLTRTGRNLLRLLRRHHGIETHTIAAHATA